MDQTPATQTKDLPQSVFKIGAYWVQSKWSQWKALPAILTIANGEISMRTKDSEVFRVPVKEMSAISFSQMLMRCTINSVPYTLRTMQPIVPVRFSREQIAELKECGMWAAYSPAKELQKIEDALLENGAVFEFKTFHTVRSSALWFFVTLAILFLFGWIGAHSHH